LDICGDKNILYFDYININILAVIFCCSFAKGCHCDKTGQRVARISQYYFYHLHKA
jgi:hypothetical protein